MELTHAGPVALFLACMVSGLLVPLPEDVAVLIAGWQVREGTLSPLEAAAAAFAGTFARDAIAFGSGRLFARGALAWPVLGRTLANPRALALRARLEARGDLLLFLTRFFIGVRAPLYFAGGTTGRPFARFAALDLAGLLLTTPLLLGLGWWLGPSSALWLEGALAHQRLVLVGVVVLGLAWWGWAWRRRRPYPPVA